MSEQDIGLVGIDNNWLVDFMIGVGVAVAFILINILVPGIAVIGLPSVAQSIAGTVGRWLIIVVASSIFETVIFFEFLLAFLETKLKIPFWICTILTGLVFALFHYVAYNSALLANSGSFISASLVGFGWCWIKKWTKSLAPLMVSHGILNAWLIRGLNIVIG